MDPVKTAICEQGGEWAMEGGEIGVQRKSLKQLYGVTLVRNFRTKAFGTSINC